MKFLDVSVLLLLVGSVCCFPRRNGHNELGELDEKETEEASPFPKCYDLECPSGTVGCSRVSKTSKDRKTIDTIVQCEDYNGRILKSDTSSKPNPDENAVIRSYSFSKVFSFTSGDHMTRRVDENVNNNDEIETF